MYEVFVWSPSGTRFVLHRTSDLSVAQWLTEKEMPQWGSIYYEWVSE